MTGGVLRVSLYVIAAWFALAVTGLAWKAARMRDPALGILACIAAAVAAVLISAAGDLRS